jgi:predicted metal-dependent enzyme (double-stranded beta helix superfamily)
VVTTEPPSVRADVDQWRLAGARAVHPSASAGAETILAAIAAGLAAVAAPWELTAGHVGRPAEHLDHELLLATEAYDAWLVHWPPGAALDVRDHGRSAGAFAVVSGVLEEASLRSGAPVTTRLRPGDVIHFEPGQLRQVANRSPASTTSVHVYAPPLRAAAPSPGGGEPAVTPTLVRSGRCGSPTRSTTGFGP